MKGYNFRLQKLLDMRVEIEEESKRKFREAQNERSRVEQKLNNLNENYEKYRNINNIQSAIERKITYSYLSALNFNINKTEEELKIKEKILEERREDLKNKQIDRKTVEILKEKGKDLFIKKQNLEEQKMNDELALYGFLRNNEGRDLGGR